MAPVFALLERGVRVAGLDLGIASRVPLESGLSSSAALEVAVASAIDRVQELHLDRREIGLSPIGGRASSWGWAAGSWISSPVPSESAITLCVSTAGVSRSRPFPWWTADFGC